LPQILSKHDIWLFSPNEDHRLTCFYSGQLHKLVNCRKEKEEWCELGRRKQRTEEEEWKSREVYYIIIIMEWRFF